MTERALLCISGLKHAFGAIKVLADVSMTIPDGGLVGLIGPNGSGKTTLFNVVSGYIEPLQGAIEFDGVDLRGRSVEDRSHLGLVRTFQTPKVFDSMSVIENIMVGCSKLPAPGPWAEMICWPGSRWAFKRMRAQAEAVCQQFDLWDLRDAATKTLAAGQRRLLEIARAVAGRPRLLMLDEPSCGLNDDEVRTLEHRLRQLRGDGISILLVSHDMELMGCVDWVHVLFNGQVLVSGDMTTLQGDARVREVYLGV
jgi:ABC-type branched-subunit amino acid transport system ATPase component